jgi:dolichol kinase
MMEYTIGIIAALVGTLAENLSFGFADDNLTIPLSIGLTMWLLYGFWLPEVQLVLNHVPR